MNRIDTKELIVRSLVKFLHIPVGKYLRIGTGNVIEGVTAPSAGVVDTYIVGGIPLAADWLSLTEGGAALTPETGKLYIVLTPGNDYINSQFRWTGAAYVQVSEPLGETQHTAYRGDRGKTAYDHSQVAGGVHVTTTERNNWNNAFSWGNHALVGYLTSITKAMVEAVLTGKITSHYHEVAPPGVSTLMDLNYSATIDKFFKPVMYVNQEHNQFKIPAVQPNIGGTPITITAINTSAHTITLDYLPADVDLRNWLVSKSVGTEPGRSGQDQQYVLIDSFVRSGAGGTITYNASVTRNIGTWANGTTVFLINIKSGWNYNMGASTFKISNVPGGWTNSTILQGGFFRTAGGNVRLIVNGYNAGAVAPAMQRTIGLARPTIEGNLDGDWTLDANARIDHTDMPAWCLTTGFVITSIINHPTDATKFIGYGNTYDTIRRIGYVIFNEDMSVVSFSSSYLPLGDGGFYQPSIALFDGKYRMFLAELNGVAAPDDGDWSFGYYESYNPLDIDSWTRVGDVNGIYYDTIRNIKDCYKSSHTTEASLFTYNGELYAFADGTSRWNASGNRGQRAIGLLKWTGKAWINIQHGPVFAGYQFADLVWSLPAGHTGGIASTIFFNNNLYFATSLTQAADQYKIIISKKIIEVV